MYVKSFKSSGGYYSPSSEENIQQVFKRVREAAPCILVLEDVDSLIDKENRSVFLNELDGFTSNQGVMILATTNYPERIDPALLNRPSRFDRKYHFELPAFTERLAYIQLWNNKLNLSNAVVKRIAELTDGFSFAYLKELLISSITQSIGTALPESMEKDMISQVTVLKEEIEKTSSTRRNKNKWFS